MTIKYKNKSLLWYYKELRDSKSMREYLSYKINKIVNEPLKLLINESSLDLINVDGECSEEDKNRIIDYIDKGLYEIKCILDNINIIVVLPASKLWVDDVGGCFITNENIVLIYLDIEKNPHLYNTHNILYHELCHYFLNKFNIEPTLNMQQYIKDRYIEHLCDLKIKSMLQQGISYFDAYYKVYSETRFISFNVRSRFQSFYYSNKIEAICEFYSIYLINKELLEPFDYLLQDMEKLNRIILVNANV